MSPFNSFDVKSVKGNASNETKENLLRSFMFATHGFDGTPGPGFADSIGARMKITEVSIKPKDSAPKREEATVVCELEVKQDMVNGAGNIHGGCSAYLMDLCTTLPLTVLPKGGPGVSQVLNMIYHAPAPLGTPLRIVSTSVAVNGRTMTSRGEIWDTKNARLVASGVHIKMLPSQSKL